MVKPKKRPQGTGSVQVTKSTTGKLRWRGGFRGAYTPTFDTEAEAADALDELVQSFIDEDVDAAEVKKRRHGPNSTPRTISNAVSAYLRELREGRTGEVTTVNLGGLRGFPNVTDDPDIVDKAIVAISERADGTSAPLLELKLRQRIVELREQVTAMREVDEGVSVLDGFIANAKAYADANGVTYNAFRSMGVSPHVLKAAGVKP